MGTVQHACWIGVANMAMCGAVWCSKQLAEAQDCNSLVSGHCLKFSCVYNTGSRKEVKVPLCC